MKTEALTSQQSAMLPELEAKLGQASSTWTAKAEKDLSDLSAIIDPEMEHMGPLADILREQKAEYARRIAELEEENQRLYKRVADAGLWGKRGVATERDALALERSDNDELKRECADLKEKLAAANGFVDDVAKALGMATPSTVDAILPRLRSTLASSICALNDANNAHDAARAEVERMRKVLDGEQSRAEELRQRLISVIGETGVVTDDDLVGAAEGLRRKATATREFAKQRYEEISFLNAEVERLKADLAQTQSDRQKEHDKRVRFQGEVESLKAKLAKSTGAAPVATVTDDLVRAYTRERLDYYGIESLRPERECCEHWAVWWGQRLAAKPTGWTCFHCRRHFSDEESARKHFGPTEVELEHAGISVDGPECQLKLEDVQKMDYDLSRYRAEDSDKDRQIASMSADHAAALRRAEEDGYANGLAAKPAIPMFPSDEQRLDLAGEIDRIKNDPEFPGHSEDLATSLFAWFADHYSFAPALPTEAELVTLLERVRREWSAEPFLLLSQFQARVIREFLKSNGAQAERPTEAPQAQRPFAPSDETTSGGSFSGEKWRCVVTAANSMLERCLLNDLQGEFLAALANWVEHVDDLSKQAAGKAVDNG
jgi:hypothetical protein